MKIKQITTGREIIKDDETIGFVHNDLVHAVYYTDTQTIPLKNLKPDTSDEDVLKSFALLQNLIDG